MANPDLDLRESIQRSRLGPVLRSCISHLQTPLWRMRGSQPPAPPHAKRAIIVEEVRRTGVRVFVETGTFRGDTVARMAKFVPRVISIELDDTLHACAVERFAGDTNVEVLRGDSASLLPGIVAELDTPALFWLDGHFSGGVTAFGGAMTPIMEELAAVLASPVAHSVLIDDARLFDGTDGYPKLEDVRSFCAELEPSMTWTVADDIIRVMPSTSS